MFFINFMGLILYRKINHDKKIFLQFILVHLIMHLFVFSLLPEILHLYLKKADVIFILFLL
jgi:hypothetical protein